MMPVINGNKQIGIITLVTSISLLIATTLISFAVAKTGIVATKMSANYYRSNKSFQGAEAGLEYALAYIQNNKSLLVDNDNDGNIDLFSNTNISNVTMSDGTSYDISFSNPAPNNFNLIKIRSSALVGDLSTPRTVEQIYQQLPALPYSTPHPLTAHGNVEMSGDLDITNLQSDQTILSGGTATLSGSSTTTISTGVSSTSGNIQSDITDNDPTLASLSNDQFFEGIFGGTKEQVKQSFDTYLENSIDTNYKPILDGVDNQTIWIEQTAGQATINSGTVIGSPEHPVLLVVNGDLKLNGNSVIYGVLYIAGDWVNTGGGTATVYGSIIVEGNMSGSGTPSVIYDPGIVESVNNGLANFVKVVGSWRDF